MMTKQDEGASQARADAAREKTKRAMKRAITESGGNYDRALTDFRREAEQDEMMMQHMFQSLLDDVLRSRPDLENDPDALVAEAMRFARLSIKRTRGK